MPKNILWLHPESGSGGRCPEMSEEELEQAISGTGGCFIYDVPLSTYVKALKRGEIEDCNWTPPEWIMDLYDADA